MSALGDLFAKYVPPQVQNVIRSADTFAGKVNNTLADALLMPSMRHENGRSAADIVESALPYDPNQGVKDAITQWRGGDHMGAFTTMMGSLPQTGMVLGGQALDRAMPGARNYAETLEREGRSPQSILTESGLHRGADIKAVDRNPWAPDSWRGEIADNTMKVIRDPNAADMVKGAKLSDFISHPKLFDANPGLANMDVIRHDGAGAPHFAEPGIYHQLPRGGIVYRAEDAADPHTLLTTMAHETNHASDYLSRLPAGSNPSLIQNPHVQSAMWDFASGLSPNDPLRRLYESLRLKGNATQDSWAKSAEDLYYRHAGESAAYATQDRLLFTPDMRRSLSILDPSVGGYQHPVDQQIGVPQGFWKNTVDRLRGGPQPPSDLFAPRH